MAARARAQQADRMRRVGVLEAGPPTIGKDRLASRPSCSGCRVGLDRRPQRAD